MLEEHLLSCHTTIDHFCSFPHFKNSFFCLRHSQFFLNRKPLNNKYLYLHNQIPGIECLSVNTSQSLLRDIHRIFTTLSKKTLETGHSYYQLQIPYSALSRRLLLVRQLMRIFDKGQVSWKWIFCHIIGLYYQNNVIFNNGDAVSIIK